MKAKFVRFEPGDNTAKLLLSGAANALVHIRAASSGFYLAGAPFDPMNDWDKYDPLTAEYYYPAMGYYDREMTIKLGASDELWGAHTQAQGGQYTYVWILEF